METKPDLQQLEIQVTNVVDEIIYLCTTHIIIFFLTEILLAYSSSSGRQTGHVLIYVKSPHI